VNQANISIVINPAHTPNTTHKGSAHQVANTSHTLLNANASSKVHANSSSVAKVSPKTNASQAVGANASQAAKAAHRIKTILHGKVSNVSANASHNVSHQVAKAKQHAAKKHAAKHNASSNANSNPIFAILAAERTFLDTYLGKVANSNNVSAIIAAARKDAALILTNASETVIRVSNGTNATAKAKVHHKVSHAHIIPAPAHTLNTTHAPAANLSIAANTAAIAKAAGLPPPKKGWWQFVKLQVT
jgi:hypothetical protein